MVQGLQEIVNLELILLCQTRLCPSSFFSFAWFKSVVKKTFGMPRKRPGPGELRWKGNSGQEEREKHHGDSQKQVKCLWCWEAGRVLASALTFRHFLGMDLLSFWEQGRPNQHHRQWESPTLIPVFAGTHNKRLWHLARVHKSKQILVVSKLSGVLTTKEAAIHPRSYTLKQCKLQVDGDEHHRTSSISEKR